MVKDTGRRDSAGLEDMDAFFSPAVEKSPKKGLGLSPSGKFLSSRTKFTAALESDKTVSMSGTSSTHPNSHSGSVVLIARLNPRTIGSSSVTKKNVTSSRKNPNENKLKIPCSQSSNTQTE